MRKASARRDRSELAAKQTQVISKVFVIYLRVLQASRTCPKEHQARILAPALEGLVKFAPLVNLELFHQLNTALKELLGIRAVSFVKQEQQQERAGRNQRHDPRALEDLARRLAAQVAVKDPKQRTITLPGGTTQDEAAAVEGEEGDEEEETCTVTTALHALVAAACLSQRDMSAEASEWKEDMVEFHNKLFQLLPKALSPPPVPPPPKEEDDEAAATDAAETQSRASSSASVSSSGSLASSTFSIAASMAQHQQFVHGSVVREWAFRCNLVVRAVDILVLCQRHLPIPRVQALARRLMELAVSCPPHIGISLVALCHRIALRYPAIKGMFIGGADNELPGRGAYRPEAANLQNSNAEGRFAWEMTLLRHSYHPAVREVAQHVASHYQRVAKAVQGATAPIVSRTLDALQADALLERYDPSRGLIVPAPALPKGMAGQRRARSPSPSNEAE
jgi:nucleolar complex protein 3